MILEVTLSEGYYTFDHKQTSYALRFNNGEWELMSSRKNYGSRFKVPTYRFFKTLKDIEKSIKGLKGLSSLIGQA